MDYSASLHDSDNPAGPSPWDSSPHASPQHNRTGFDNIGSEPPTSPFQYNANRSSNGMAAEQNVDVNDQGSGGTDAHISDETAVEHEAAVENREEIGPSTGESERVDSSGEAPAQEPQSRKPSRPQFKLQAKITGLERTGKKDPILRFDVHTNLPNFRTSQYRDVRRLHSEFVKLAEHLISANPHAIVHAVPPALTSAGAGTDEDESRVKALLQRWLNYTCSNEVLMRDEEMVLFVESDFGYSPMVKMKQPATGVRRKILKQFAPPPDDTPELSEARPTVKLFYLGTMDAGHKVDRIVKSRRGLGLSEAEFGVKLGSMNVQEPHPGLANAYRKLGKIVQAVGDFHAAQATAEATTLGDPFQYHSSDAFIVKETLTNRQILIREYLQAQETTRSKLNAADRLKASSNVRREKVDEAIAALDEAQHNEDYLRQRTTSVTNNLVRERHRWFARTASDLRLSIREYVIRQIEAERRTLALLESVRPDIRSIDASGGLSRLGREAHPTVRRTSVAASQGPKGDAWSGVPRRSDTLSRSGSSGFITKVPEEQENQQGPESRQSRLSGSSLGGLSGVKEEDDDDRIDAKNAASRLATSTF